MFLVKHITNYYNMRCHPKTPKNGSVLVSSSTFLEYPSPCRHIAGCDVLKNLIIILQSLLWLYWLILISSFWLTDTMLCSTTKTLMDNTILMDTMLIENQRMEIYFYFYSFCFIIVHYYELLRKKCTGNINKIMCEKMYW